jgi:hypothetical protein
MKKIAPTNLMICPTWRQRLRAAFAGILSFSQGRHGRDVMIRGASSDARTLVEFLEQDGVLVRSSLLLALPEPESLEILKLGCWTLLYLKSMFPDWVEVDGWVKEAAEWTTETGDSVEKHLQGYRVVCLFDRSANVLEFQVKKD